MNDYIQKALDADSAWLEVGELSGKYLDKAIMISHGDTVVINHEICPLDPRCRYLPLDSPDLLFAEVKRLRALLDIAGVALKNERTKYTKHDDLKYRITSEARGVD